MNNAVGQLYRCKHRKRRNDRIEEMSLCLCLSIDLYSSNEETSLRRLLLTGNTLCPVEGVLPSSTASLCLDSVMRNDLCHFVTLPQLVDSPKSSMVWMQQCSFAVASLPLLIKRGESSLRWLATRLSHNLLTHSSSRLSYLSLSLSRRPDKSSSSAVVVAVPNRMIRPWS